MPDFDGPVLSGGMDHLEGELMPSVLGGRPQVYGLCGGGRIDFHHQEEPVVLDPQGHGGGGDAELVPLAEDVLVPVGGISVSGQEQSEGIPPVFVVRLGKIDFRALAVLGGLGVVSS
ncbi:MAG: hypothetical protein WD426_02220 [Anditalea sp.]